MKGALPQKKNKLWLPIQASLKYNHSLKLSSKKTQTILRREPHLREPAGAAYWPTWMQIVSDPDPHARSGNVIRVGIEHCFDSHGELQYIRSIEDHSGVPRNDPQFFTLLELPYEWKVHTYLSGSSNNYRSIVEGGLIARGISNRRARQACFHGPIQGAVCPIHGILHERTSNSALQTFTKT